MCLEARHDAPGLPAGRWYDSSETAVTMPALPNTTENAALRRLIAERIAAGPLTFRDFMEMALYHPEHGYYSSSRPTVGRDGDFITSPEVHPAFTYTLSALITTAWDAMGGPGTVVEAGAGNGTMAADLLAVLPPATRYRIIEASPALEATQRQRLRDYGARVEWASWESAPAGGERTVVITNELFDALPVHRVRMEDGEGAPESRLREIYVVERDGELDDAPGEVSTPELAAYFRRAGVWPGGGCLAEVNLAAEPLMARLAGMVGQGAVITFDYGYETARLYAPWRREGTLLSFYRHTSDTQPYARVGRQDLTAHVDWTALRAAGESAGLTTVIDTTQSELLAALGIGGYLAGAVAGTGLEEHLARRRAISELLDPAGLGRIRAMVQYRGDARLGAALKAAGGSAHG